VQFIRQFFLNFRNRSLTKKPLPIARTNKNYTEAKQIGVLFCMPENAEHAALNLLIQHLGTEGKQVQVLAFLPDQSHRNHYQFEFDFFTPKDISLTGEITAAEVQKFIATPFDYLFCVAPKPFGEVDNVLLQSKAKCRVGVYDAERTACYELMISPLTNAPLTKVLDTMLRYTKNLTQSAK
jgi:hypothetical protein